MIKNQIYNTTKRLNLIETATTVTAGSFQDIGAEIECDNHEYAIVICSMSDGGDNITALDLRAVLRLESEGSDHIEPKYVGDGETVSDRTHTIDITNHTQFSGTGGQFIIVVSTHFMPFLQLQMNVTAASDPTVDTLDVVLI